jgi:hypothetical protein
MVWANSDGSITLSDRRGVGHSAIVDSSQDLTLLPGSGYDSSSGKLLVNFQRLKDTGDSSDRVIKNEPQNWIYAWSPVNPGNADPAAFLNRHQAYAAPSARNVLLEPTPTTVTTLPTSSPTSGTDDGALGEDNEIVEISTEQLLVYTRAHGTLMFLAWHVLIPAAIFVAMFEKESLGVWWFRIHIILTLFAGIFMLIALALMLSISGPAFDNTHTVLGIITMVLAIGIQMPLGIYIDKKWNPNRTRVPWHDRLHQWLGRIAFVLTFAVIHLGFLEYEEEFTGSIGLVLPLWYAWSIGVVFLGVFVLYGGYRYRKQKRHGETLSSKPKLGEEDSKPTVMQEAIASPTP